MAGDLIRLRPKKVATYRRAYVFEPDQVFLVTGVGMADRKVLTVPGLGFVRPSHARRVRLPKKEREALKAKLQQEASHV